jgi:uncharacterized membrane protein
MTDTYSFTANELGDKPSNFKTNNMESTTGNKTAMYIAIVLGIATWLASPEFVAQFAAIGEKPLLHIKLGATAVLAIFAIVQGAIVNQKNLRNDKIKGNG